MTDTDQSASPFGPPLSEDVVFEAAVLRRPLHGRKEADAALQAAGGYYASNVPIRKTVDGDRTYIEFEARLPSGTALSGVTVLTVNADGQITRIAVHHRPLEAVLEFSREMGKRTAGQIPPGHFYET